MTRIDELEKRIRPLGSCVVAFSGGVDSSLVAALAWRALGGRALAVTAVSPALATGELDGAQEVARAIGIRHETITTAELEREGYGANDRDRCYHCKSELYDRLGALAARRRYAAVLSGANADDLGDWRTRLNAAAEHAVDRVLGGGVSPGPPVAEVVGVRSDSTAACGARGARAEPVVELRLAVGDGESRRWRRIPRAPAGRKWWFSWRIPMARATSCGRRARPCSRRHCQGPSAESTPCERGDERPSRRRQRTRRRSSPGGGFSSRARRSSSCVLCAGKSLGPDRRLRSNRLDLATARAVRHVRARDVHDPSVEQADLDPDTAPRDLDGPAPRGRARSARAARHEHPARWSPRAVPRAIAGCACGGCEHGEDEARAPFLHLHRHRPKNVERTGLEASARSRRGRARARGRRRSSSLEHDEGRRRPGEADDADDVRPMAEVLGSRAVAARST